MFEGRKQKKLDLAISELEKESKVLSNKFIGINNWIENNPDSDPNLYEMIECTYDFGKLCATYQHYHDKYQPVTKEENEDIYDVMDDVLKQDMLYYSSRNAYLGVAKKSLDRMIELRYQHELFTDPTAKNLYDEIYNTAVNGDFDLENERANELKKKVLSKLGGVYNFIHQEQLKNPKYLYDNTDEFKQLQSDFSEYLSKSKNRQFESIMAETIVVINSNYKYNPQIDLSNRNNGPTK